MIVLENFLLNLRRTHAITIGEIENIYAKFFEIVVFAGPIVAHHEDINVEFLDNLRVVERALGNHHVGIAKGFQNCKTFLEGNHRGTLVTTDQFISTHAHDERIAQAAGIFYHLEVVGVEHIEGSRRIYHYFLLSYHRI